MDTIYVETEDDKIIRLSWSDNPPVEPEKAVGVIGIDVYTKELHEVDGGELDACGSNILTDYVDDCITFMELPLGLYSVITEGARFDELEQRLDLVS